MALIRPAFNERAELDLVNLWVNNSQSYTVRVMHASQPALFISQSTGTHALDREPNRLATALVTTKINYKSDPAEYRVTVLPPYFASRAPLS